MTRTTMNPKSLASLAAIALIALAAPHASGTPTSAPASSAPAAPAPATTATPAPSAISVWFMPFDDAETAVLRELDRAQRTVHVAHYNIRNERMFHKLLDLRARGIEVQVVVDAKNARNAWNTLDDQMEAAGIDIVRFENTRSAMAIMHHKFSVIDGETVLTGSYNWNHTAQLSNNENMVLVRSAALAAKYEREFAELRGLAREASERFDSRAAADVAFAPEDGVRNVIVREIARARTEVAVAMFALSDGRITAELEAAARRGVSVVLLTEGKEADHFQTDERLARAGAYVVIGRNDSSAFSAMHQKYAVIDRAVVLTGACNWTYTAVTHSNEDVLVLRDADLALAYLRDLHGMLVRYDPAFDPRARPLPPASHAAVNFIARHDATAFGDAVLVVGDLPELGGWDPARGIELRTSDDVFPSWSGGVALPAGTPFEYKLVTRTPDGTIFWEQGENRRAETSADGFGLSLREPYRR